MKNIKEKGTILPAVIFFLVLFIFIADFLAKPIVGTIGSIATGL